MEGTRKTRVEDKFRNIRSKDGSFSPHIGKATTERLTKYCHNINMNKTKFVEKCINERLDVLEGEYYSSMSKEELIKLLLKH